MREDDLPTLLRLAIVVLTIAVLLCLALPMEQGEAGMALGFFCCFALAVLLSVFHFVGRSRDVLFVAIRTLVAPVRPVAATARAPNRIALRSLLR